MSLPTTISAGVIDAADALARIDAMTPEDAGEFWAKATALKGLFDEWYDTVKGGMVEYIESHGDVPIQTAQGERRLYVTVDRPVKCNSPGELLEYLLSITDVQTIKGLLASAAWKQGACKPVLGREWGQHFTEEERPKLVEGAAGPRKRIAQTFEGNDAVEKFFDEPKRLGRKKGDGDGE